MLYIDKEKAKFKELCSCQKIFMVNGLFWCSCFEFGTVHIPVKTRQLDRSLEELVRSFDKYSLELFSRTSTTFHLETLGRLALSSLPLINPALLRSRRLRMIHKWFALLIKGRIKKFHKFDISRDMFMCIFNIRHHNPTSQKWIKWPRKCICCIHMSIITKKSKVAYVLLCFLKCSRRPGTASAATTFGGHRKGWRVSP